MNMQSSSWLARFTRRIALAALATVASVALAQPQPAPSDEQPQADPPARVGALTAAQGSVVFAPAGDTDWSDLPHNRPIVDGDRLWTDEGARAEVSFGSSVLHMDSRTFVEVIAVDDDVVQLAVNQGSVDARARELRAGDGFEISTPQLALRATQPGEWRIDVDPQQGLTRITAHSGVALLYGSGGNVQQIVAGQQLAFAGRELRPANVGQALPDDFGRWAFERNRALEDSLAARYIPRDVVAATELDAWGAWSLDPDYGAVWYPEVSAADWAPYRYGHWESIAPWGWTWVDDAPWGFAPFHYGRWTMIGTRWAWVPGPLGRHPVYAPALVAFVGGPGGAFSLAGGPGIGWYPLGPGEIWRPYWNASPAYVRDVNRYLVRDSRGYNTGPHLFGHRPDAITSARVDDFDHGRFVAPRRGRVRAQDIMRVQPTMPPVPTREARREVPREPLRSAAPQRPPEQRRSVAPQAPYSQPAQRVQAFRQVGPAARDFQQRPRSSQPRAFTPVQRRPAVSPQRHDVRRVQHERRREPGHDDRRRND